MQYLFETRATPAENLALDEALLDAAEAAVETRRAEQSEALPVLATKADERTTNSVGRGVADEVLRLWESPVPFVVLGSSSKHGVEANVETCERDGVPILRRSSGGAAVMAGPGCLMYAVILSYERRPELRDISAAHRFVIGSIVAALSKRVPVVDKDGTSDLVTGGRKFSGNSLRCKRDHFLYHGTILYDFPLDALPRYLGDPPRKPEYRRDRAHEEFVTNLPLPRDEIIAALREAFVAGPEIAATPNDRIAALVQDRYGRQDWTKRFE
ncbi:MAG: lipoate--protein ligase family protein [Pirellulales bacterium]